jgi:hypothetical protein
MGLGKKSVLNSVMKHTSMHERSGAIMQELGVFLLNACIISQSRKKAFYLTKNKYFGTAPDRISESIETDDRIAIIAGLKMPVVLRPRPDGTYTFVSHCYLHGVMYGEAVHEVTDELKDIILI